MIRDQIHVVAGRIAGLFRKTKVDRNNLQAEMFMQLAGQYYATARFAMHAQRLPVCGNLFHHAIEMALKGGLGRKRKLSELRYMGHNLKALWREFKKEHPHLSLKRHDKTISTLNKLEDIRYPGTKGSIEVIADWDDTIPPVTKHRGRTPKKYLIVVSNIDDLFADIFKASSWNPPKFMGNNAAALEAITRFNDQSKFLTQG